jgi:hypothetical protein
MKLLLTRDIFGESYTLGKLFIDGKFFCYTCEDKVRPKKIYAVTAIPAGKYSVSLTWSPTFKRVLPLIENVPGYEGIRIHNGNTDVDTKGCPLVGLTRTKNGVGDSRKAMALLMPILQKAWDDELFIEIEIT